jgi:hypothetical protein
MRRRYPDRAVEIADQIIADIAQRQMSIVGRPTGRSSGTATDRPVAQSDRLGNNPMLDADIFTAVRIGPACDVVCREESGYARFEIGVHDHSAIEREAVLGKFGPDREGLIETPARGRPL